VCSCRHSDRVLLQVLGRSPLQFSFITNDRVRQFIWWCFELKPCLPDRSSPYVLREQAGFSTWARVMVRDDILDGAFVRRLVSERRMSGILVEVRQSSVFLLTV